MPSSSEYKRLVKYVVAVGLCWTLLLAGAWWYLDREHHSSLMAALAKGAEKELAGKLRLLQWAARYQGIYVRPSPGIKPGPYADPSRRQARTQRGERLIFMPPCQLVRQVARRSMLSGELEVRLTALDPVNPANRPDPWERRALEAVSQGRPVPSQIISQNGRPVLRLMRPLIITSECLRCHQEKKYRPGQVRGGISLSVPLSFFDPLFANYRLAMNGSFVLLWLLGLLGLGATTLRLRRRLQERDQVMARLTESEARYRQTFENTAAIKYIIDPVSNRFVDANQAALSFYGYSLEEMKRLTTYDLNGLPPEVVHFNMYLVATGRQSYFQVTHRLKSGELREMEVYVSPIEHQGRQLNYAIAHDITDRMEAKRRLDRQNRLLIALHQTSLELIARRDLDGVLQSIVARAADLADTPDGWLAMLSEDGQYLLHRYSVGLYRKFQGFEFRPGQGLSGRVWQSGEVLRVEDYCTYANRMPHRGLDQVGPTMGVPIKRDQEVIGVIGLGRKRGGKPFADEDVAILEQFAQLASLAIENARLHEAARKEIADRKAAQKELQEQRRQVEKQNEFLADILASLTHPFYVVDVENYQVTLDNRRLEAVEGPPLTCYQLAHGRNQPCPDDTCPLRQVVASGEEITMEHVHRDEQGRLRNVEVHCYPIKDSQGQVRYVIEYALDITERIKAERSLKESEERYRNTFEASPDAIIISDLEGMILREVNPGFTALTGYQRDEVLGRRLLDLDLVPNRMEFHRARQLLKEVGRLDDFEFTFRTKGGQLRRALASSRPLTYEGRQCLVSIVKDITPLKEAEQEKLRLEAQLMQARKLEAVGTLAGGVAHDFNNLLQVISGYTQLLLAEEGLDPDMKEHLSKISKSAANAVELVRQLLAFSGKLKSHKEPTDLNQRVKSTVNLLRRTIPRMIEIELDLEPNLPRIMADPTQMDQIIINLVRNASDAMPEGGRVTIRTRKVTLKPEQCQQLPGLEPGPYLRMQVSDTGHGIPEEVVSQIFDPFFTTKEQDKGIGLGLSSAYGVVENHGGRILCHSRPGQGSVFTIYLPLHEPLPLKPHKNEFVDSTEGRGETILVVDDEPAILQLAKEVLERKGYHLVLAHTGEEALEKYRRDPDGVDLVLLDLSMPGMGGKRCLEELLKLDPGVRVIIASGYAEKSRAQELMTLGALGFLAKPYRLEELLLEVRRVLANR